MVTVEFILEGNVLASKETKKPNDQADTAAQYRERQRVTVNGNQHRIERVNHNTDADTLEIYLSDILA